MNIACVVATHTDCESTRETVESVLRYMTKDVFVLVDTAHWGEFSNWTSEVGIYPGVYHNYYRSNYRNYAMAMDLLQGFYPEADWYCWLEYDVLITSSRFKEDLITDAWMLGCDYRVQDFGFTLLQDLLGTQIKDAHYLLGCLHFVRGDIVRKLGKFFANLLEATKSFPIGDFPGYDRHAFEEEMLPTAVVSMGGSIKELSCWEDGNWRGSSKYLVRFEPDVSLEEITHETSIVHPVKNSDNPIREHYRHRLIPV